MEFIAKCGSFSCTSKTLNVMKKSDYIIVDVPKGTVTCPSCNHALRWVKIRKTLENKRNKNRDSLKLFNLNDK